MEGVTHPSYCSMNYYDKALIDASHYITQYYANMYLCYKNYDYYEQVTNIRISDAVKAGRTAWDRGWLASVMF